MNILVLDSKTVCVEKSEVYQAEQLDKLGMEVVPVQRIKRSICFWWRTSLLYCRRI